METSETSLTTLDNPQHGGTLFTLPRELRDEIYRLVVKDRHLMLAHKCEKSAITVRTEKCNFSIFGASKVISREVLEIAYKESVFSFDIRRDARALKRLPRSVTDRMKNVYLTLSYIYPYLYGENDLNLDHVNALCKAVITPFAGTHIARNSLHVFICCDNEDVLPLQVVEYLKALNGFRTVVVDVSLFCLLRYMDVTMGMNTVDPVSEVISLMLRGALRMIRRTLESSLGSATESLTGGVGHLTFHPREQ